MDVYANDTEVHTRNFAENCKYTLVEMSLNNATSLTPLNPLKIYQ